LVICHRMRKKHIMDCILSPQLTIDGAHHSSYFSYQRVCQCMVRI
jgi:hypothetical protein